GQGDGSHRGPVLLGARRTLRGDRRQPLPDTRRPAPATVRPPPPRLLGTQPRRPPHQQAPRSPRPGRRGLPAAPVNPLAGADRPAAGRTRPAGGGRRLRVLPDDRALPGRASADRQGRGAVRRIPSARWPNRHHGRLRPQGHVDAVTRAGGHGSSATYRLMSSRPYRLKYSRGHHPSRVRLLSCRTNLLTYWPSFLYNCESTSSGSTYS